MGKEAPHLPEDTTPRKSRKNFFLFIVFFIALIAGASGGMFIVRIALPALIVGSHIQTNDVLRTQNRIKDESTIPFGAMATLTHPVIRVSGNKELIGYAVQLSLDGWLLTHKNIALQKKIAIEINNERVVVDRVVLDPSSDIAFIHVARNFTSISDIGENTEVIIGETVYIPVPKKGILSLRYNALFVVPEIKGQIFSSEKYFRMHTLDTQLDATYSGAPVFNKKGLLVGIVSSVNETAFTEVLPMHDISTIFKQAAKENRISRPFLGVHYKISAGARIDVKTEERGARIEGGSKSVPRPIEKNAPASVAGLREKDVIVEVENEDVGLTQTLPDLILAYRPGQEITLTVVRNDERLKIPVKLGVLK